MGPPESGDPIPTHDLPKPPPEAWDVEIERLVLAARKGDKDAARELWNRHHRQMLATARGYVRQMADAEEVLQEAVLKAFSKLDTLKEPRAFSGWLKQIVVSLALNHRRASGLRRKHAAAFEEQVVDQFASDSQSAFRSDDSRPRDPADVVQGRELLTKLAAAMEQLSPAQRQALQGAIDGLPQAELAEQMKTSVQMIKYHTFEARKKLKKLVPEADAAAERKKAGEP